MKLSRIVGNAYDQSREYEKTRYPQLMWTPGKAFMEFTDSNVAVRIPDSHPLWLDMVDMVFRPEWVLQWGIQVTHVTEVNRYNTFVSYGLR